MNEILTEAIESNVRALISCKRASVLLETLGLTQQVKELKAVISMLGKISRQLKELKVEEVEE